VERRSNRKEAITQITFDGGRASKRGVYLCEQKRQPHKERAQQVKGKNRAMERGLTKSTPLAKEIRQKLRWTAKELSIEGGETKGIKGNPKGRDCGRGRLSRRRDARISLDEER